MRIARGLGYKYEIEYEYDFSCHVRLPHGYNFGFGKLTMAQNLSVMYSKASNLYINVEQIISFFPLGY